jgi:nucleoside-diphosphate-sugar epimerase
MRVFVAGASGAIGRPLIAELIRRGHTVTGMTRSEVGARHLAALGAVVARVSAFDAPALERAVRESRAEVVIDELTALPGHPSEMAAAAAAERARVAVTKAIKYALGKIAEQDAALADHLRRSVRTGYFCAYDPSPADPIVWDV